MRYIFVDEAGTSKNEKVSVVFSLIVRPDEHVMDAERLVTEAYQACPPEWNEKYQTFHAKDIFAGHEFRDKWNPTDRYDLLDSMMSIPRRLGMSFAIGAVWRNCWSELGLRDHNAIDLAGLKTDIERDHYMAFLLSLCTADKGMRMYASPYEVATVIAEDHQSMRSRLKEIPRLMSDNPIFLAPNEKKMVGEDYESGYQNQNSDLRIVRIRKPVFFVNKGDDIVVDVSDACAFGIRRYFESKDELGKRFAQNILGSEATHHLDIFGPPWAARVFWNMYDMHPQGSKYSSDSVTDSEKK